MHKLHLGAFLFTTFIFLAGYFSVGIYSMNNSDLNLLKPQMVLATADGEPEAAPPTSEAPKPEPAKPEPAKTEPAKTEPSKPVSSPEPAPNGNILTDTAGVLTRFVAGIILQLATWMLKMAFWALALLITVAGYNGFIHSTAVNIGWVMVRDVTNMFFVVILLLVAFGTILGLEQYEWKKMLVKFFFAAVLVNFSRVICGVIIDVGQVVMITFVNGVAATAGGNLINAFSVDKILGLSGSADPAAMVDNGQLFVASVGALVFSSIIFAMMLAFLWILVSRLIVLWILIVLSPFAFVLSVIPQTQKYASQWWSEFGNHVVVGPAIVFFLWLAFAVVGGGQIGAEISKDSAIPDAQKNMGDENAAGVGGTMGWDKMANFAIAIGILLVGAKTSQSLGTVGGSAMGKATDFGKKVAMVASGASAAMWAGNKAKEGATAAAKWGMMKAPIIGGDKWKERGAAIHEKALNLGEGWNKKIGTSRFASAFHVGRHEKIMKEREKTIKVSKDNMQSSVKGAHIDYLKRHADEMEGKQITTKGSADMRRQTIRDTASLEALNDKEIGEKYRDSFVKKTTASNKLDTGKTNIELSAVRLAEHGGVNEMEFIKSIHDRQTVADTLGVERKTQVTEVATSRKEADTELLKQSGDLESLEKAIVDLQSAVVRIDAGEDSQKVYDSLPHGAAGIVLDEHPEVYDDPSNMAQAIKETLNKKIEDHKKASSELKFGDLKLNAGGDTEKQIAILEDIKKEMSKQTKDGTGDLAAVWEKHGKGSENAVGLTKDQELGGKFIQKNMGRNIETALETLKHIEKQKKDNKAKNLTAPISLGNATKTAVQNQRIDISTKQQIEMSGTINLSSIAGMGDQSAAMKAALEKAGITKDSIGRGLNPDQINNAIKNLSSPDVENEIKKLGVTNAAFEKMIRSLNPEGSNIDRTTVEGIMNS